MVLGGLPREGECCERRVDRHRLELEAVSAIQVGEFVGVVPLQRTRPGADLLVHQSEDRRRGMQCEVPARSEEHTSELQSRLHLVCRLLLEKKKKIRSRIEPLMH